MTLEQQSYQMPLILHSDDGVLARSLIQLAKQAQLSLQHQEISNAPPVFVAGEQRLSLALPVHWPSLLPHLKRLATAPKAALYLDSQRRCLIDAPQALSIPLTDKEFAILSALMQAQGVLSRADLRQRVWGQDVELETHTLETHMYRLRQKLQQAGIAAEIQAAGDGYEFMTLPRFVTGGIV